LAILRREIFQFTAAGWGWLSFNGNEIADARHWPTRTPVRFIASMATSTSQIALAGTAE